MPVCNSLKILITEEAGAVNDNKIIHFMQPKERAHRIQDKGRKGLSEQCADNEGLTYVNYFFVFIFCQSNAAYRSLTFQSLFTKYSSGQ